MRLHRFYLDAPILAGQVPVKDPRLLHQWRNVLKFTAGSRFIVFTGNGREHECEMISLEREHASLCITSTQQSTPRARRVTLHISLIKKDNLEFVLEKCTEIGVTAFIPVISDRSEKKSFNRERAEKILVEATEQSGFGIVPMLAETETLERALKNAAGRQLACDTTGGGQIADHIHASVGDVGATEKDIGLWVGPEGGWSERERELFRGHDAHFVTLGPSTLRAETAAIVASAFALF